MIGYIFDHVKEKEKSKRARYGAGCLWLLNGIYWIKWRGVKRLPDGTARYIQHATSTGSADRVFARRAHACTASGGEGGTC